MECKPPGKYFYYVYHGSAFVVCSMEHFRVQFASYKIDRETEHDRELAEC
jgi:hypothetical protein